MSIALLSSVGPDPTTSSASRESGDSPGASQAGAIENRRHPRVPFRGRAQAVIFPPPSAPADAEPEASEVVTSDLSRGGVSLLHRQPLVVGQQLLLLLQESTQLVEVCWCCCVWDDLYMAGCRFLSVPGKLDDIDPQTAVDIVLAGSDDWLPADRRGF